MSDSSGAQVPESRKRNMYPAKPRKAGGFKQAVAWFGGRELIASLKGAIIYAIYGENFDPRNWMNANIYPPIQEKVINKKEIELTEQIEKERKTEPDADAANSSVQEAQVKKTIRETEEIQDEIAGQVEKEWATKIFEQWKWKREHYELWEEFSANENFWKRLQPENNEIKEFWFDYISDSGDGQMGVYNVACLCLADLWIDKEECRKIDRIVYSDDDHPAVSFDPPAAAGLDKKILLPRGSFLFVGGDTAYHASSYSTLVERFQNPFRWAFSSVRRHAAKHYRLKKEKLDAAEAFIEKKLAQCPEKKQEIVENRLPGALPDTIKGIDYVDTEPLRPLFGIPANHDYYDGIDGFNRLFRRAPFKDIEENMWFEEDEGRFLLQIPTFTRAQEASYIAIRLPFDWWMFGIDSENEKLDFRQKLYFKQIVEQRPRKLILATPEPTTVFGKKADENDKTAVYMKTILESLGLSQPFLTGGRIERLNGDAEEETGDGGESGDNGDNGETFCRLDLSGDVHHYARYWGENTRGFRKKVEDFDPAGHVANAHVSDDYAAGFASPNYASVVAGGGGAFFDVTRTLIGKPLDENKKPLFDNPKIRGEIPPQRVYPSEKKSVSATADRIFDLWNLRRGGYVQIAGGILSVILFYFLAYFSNVSDIIKQWDKVKQYFCDQLTKDLFITFCLLAGVAVFIASAAFSVKKLIQRLKERSVRDQLNEHWDGRIIQFSLCLIPLVPAAVLYLITLKFVFANIDPAGEKNALQAFFQSLIIVLHLVIFAFIIRLSTEHTNWLTVRFKLVRQFKRKTVPQKFEDPNEETDWKILKILGALSRIYSYQYLFPNLLVFSGIVLLIAGFHIFGRDDIAKMAADAVLIAIISGMLFLTVYYLALKTGAAYHRNWINKSYFILIGIWHYFLQIATPLVLFFFGSWLYLLINFLLVGLFNGSAVISAAVRYFSGESEKDSLLKKIADFRSGAVLTKKLSPALLFLFWFVYGLALVSAPFIFPPEKSIFVSIRHFFAGAPETLFGYQAVQSFFTSFFNITPETFNYYAAIWVSAVVIGYIGYLMSRVWLGWYLAVSMMFDGHNNEAGGAARIEGFKHILRIKIERRPDPETQKEKDKITVYVIGFDEAKPELEQIKPKLVDKFSLECRPAL